MPAEVLYNKQIAPSGPERWATVPPILEELKAKARSLGLWNLWLAGGEFQHLAGGGGVGISNVEYAVLAEISAHCQRICPEAMNCSAPDTGNMGEGDGPMPLSCALTNVAQRSSLASAPLPRRSSTSSLSWTARSARPSP